MPRNSNSDRKIRDAINQRKRILIEYSGEDEFGVHKRTVEPWCYGIHKDTGRRVLRAYQIEGYSESSPDELPAWKLLRVDRMEAVEITETDISERSPPEYNPDDPHMNVILARVEKTN